MTEYEKYRKQLAKEEFERLGIHSVVDYEKAVKKMKPLNIAIFTCDESGQKVAK
jgi:hypothetical protein